MINIMQQEFKIGDEVVAEFDGSHIFGKIMEPNSENADSFVVQTYPYSKRSGEIIYHKSALIPREHVDADNISELKQIQQHKNNSKVKSSQLTMERVRELLGDRMPSQRRLGGKRKTHRKSTSKSHKSQRKSNSKSRKGGR